MKLGVMLVGLEIELELEWGAMLAAKKAKLMDEALARTLATQMDRTLEGPKGAVLARASESMRGW